MKKETNSNKDQNRAIWEEFVVKNRIKKNYSSSGNTRFNDLKKKAPVIVEEFVPHPKYDTITEPLEVKSNYFGHCKLFQILKQEFLYRQLFF